MGEGKITIGVISKPQGIKGELKIQPLTDDVARFNSLTYVFLGAQRYTVEGVRVSAGEVFLRLSGVPDRNAAELLRGKELKVDRADAVPLKEGRYFIVDLIGMQLLMGGEVIGTVTDIVNYGAGDVVSAVTKDNKGFMFPYLNATVLDVNLDTGIMTLDEKSFKETAVYED